MVRVKAVTFSTICDKKRHEYAIVNGTLGPVELWAFCTTAEDARIRNKLYQKIGPAEARRVLAIYFVGFRQRLSKHVLLHLKATRYDHRSKSTRYYRSTCFRNS